MATVDADGIPTIIAPTGPFGERTPQHIAPQNTANGVSNDYLGVHRKASETDYLIQPIQMGARVYIPELGRFLRVDPIEGGTLNNYVYAQDPVNQRDLNGKFIQFLAIAALVARVIPVVVAVVKVVPKVATKVVQAAKTVYTAVKNVVASIPKSVPRTTTTATKPSAAPTPVQVTQVPVKPQGIPSSWIQTPSKSGRGMRYTNPLNNNDIVRVIPGNPYSSYASQRLPYVVRQTNGKFFDQNGNIVSKTSSEAHIPYDDFIF